MPGERLIIDGGHPDPDARFEKGATLAYSVENGGYRSGAATWRFQPIAELPGAKARGRKLVDLTTALDEGNQLPGVRIEPTTDGGVRVTSTVRLMVQAYGETSAIEAGQAAIVQYGSVVRAGPLMIAPLYEEQAESVQLGAMLLPEPTGGFFEEEERLSRLDRALPKNPRRPILWAWGTLWGLSFPVATVGMLFVSSSPGNDSYGRGREMVYAIGAMWFLLIVVGLAIHKLVSNYVHAGQPDVQD